jgi:hypothetical protein
MQKHASVCAQAHMHATKKQAQKSLLARITSGSAPSKEIVGGM